MAQAHGIDGFAMDFGEWCDAKGQPSRYVQNMDNMFEAAKQPGTGFKLMLTPEYPVQPVDVNVEHMVKRYYDHPNAMRRDGVMDLAGNVAEWCGDWYQLYSAGEQTDPLETRESHSRVIRGGSWGYYGCSQRSRDREFNSRGYPGYIYIGFRVALPEAGGGS